MARQDSSRIEEFTARCGRIRKQMQAQGLDGLFLMQPMNVWYVSGFWEYVPIRIQAVLVPAEGDCVFIVSKNEYEYAVKSSWISDIRYYTEFPEQGRHQNPYDLIADAIRDRGLERAVLGFEEDFMPVSDYGHLTGLLPQMRFKEGSSVLKRCRMVKSPYEIDLLKKAGAVACAGWHASVQVARAGIREFEIGEAAREAATRTAASFMSEVEDRHHSPLTDGVQLVQAGERSSISHGRGSTNRLKDGDMVAMCFCLTNQFKGYKVGFARNFCVGRPTQEMRDVYKLLYDAQMAAFDELKPGVKGSELDRLVRKRIDAAGYGRYVEHRLGRGVGVLYAEAPDLKEGDDTVIEADFCLSIEPAVYMTGKWGIEIEDSVHVTRNGWEYLTEPAPPELPIV
ncbi:MAG: aminopeptidase P family protein [Hyphomicrobiales bacterium]|nr:aminopeptidase P family protein [Hyphomicrobiales bacterium]